MYRIVVLILTFMISFGNTQNSASQTVTLTIPLVLDLSVPGEHLLITLSDEGLSTTVTANGSFAILVRTNVPWRLTVADGSGRHNIIQGEHTRYDWLEIDSSHFEKLSLADGEPVHIRLERRYSQTR